MQAVIYQPAKTAMQSGRANTRRWQLEFDQEAARRVEPLMGWTASSDMRQELALRFESREAAVAFCEKHGIPYRIQAAHQRRVRPKAYADNFSFYSVRGPGSEPIERP
ncbi:MAG TPA: ETC complex I subunit [Alphaproteobacteria bacterium]|nr:ETC complex I subunit [Alphaproteobacteria bacterium]